jgi:hypothetical protein
MMTKMRASNCAWAIPTIAAEAPTWLEGDACAWTCRRASPPLPLESTEVCADCRFWQARPFRSEVGDETRADRIDRPMLFDLIAHRI